MLTKDLTRRRLITLEVESRIVELLPILTCGEGIKVILVHQTIKSHCINQLKLQRNADQKPD